MGIQFNGNVTVNGNVEMFDNGSMKITNNQYNVSLDQLKDLINNQLNYSENKQDYLDAVDTIKQSTDKSLIKDALSKLKDLGKELGKNISISGLSAIAVEALKELLQHGI